VRIRQIIIDYFAVTTPSSESAQDNSITNNTYTSIENRVGQGRPVPILLGEMKVGSNVGSLGIDTTNNKDALDVVS
jgi:predicted phage tail protein